MEIKKGIQTVEIDCYEVFDKKFTDEEEAKRYLEEQKKALLRKYYVVATIPDLELGEGYYQNLIISIPNKYGVNFLYQYLLLTYGKPLTAIYSTNEIVNNYEILEEHEFTCPTTLNKFLTKEREIKFGNKSVNATLDVLNINEDDLF